MNCKIKRRIKLISLVFIIIFNSIYGVQISYNENDRGILGSHISLSTNSVKAENPWRALGSVHLYLSIDENSRGMTIFTAEKGHFIYNTRCLNQLYRRSSSITETQIATIPIDSNLLRMRIKSEKPQFTEVTHNGQGIAISADGYFYIDNIQGDIYISNNNTSYAYYATIEYQYCNRAPVIGQVIPPTNKIYTENDTGIAPAITVSDGDNNNLTCTYYVDGETIPRDTKTVSNTISPQTVNFTPLNMSTFTDGNHTVRFDVDDGVDAKISQSYNFIVDKTKPIISSLSVSSSLSSITATGLGSDAIAGLTTYPYKFTLNGISTSGYITATSYVWNGLNPNTAYSGTFEAQDRVGHVVSAPIGIYTKADMSQVAVGNPSSYTLDTTVTDTNPSYTQYLVLVNGSKYVTQEGLLTTSPAWITLSNKKIKIQGLAPSTIYSIQVKAKNGEGVETAYSASASGTTLVAPPGSPASIVATATDTSISVSWDAVAGATSYDIEVDGAVINNGTSTHYTKASLAPGTPHTFRVRAKNEGGAGAWCTPISKTTLPSVAGVPANLNAVPLSTTVTVTWDAVAGATGYDIEVDGVLVANGPNTNYKHTSLTPGTSHTYRVRSINPGGKSQYSNPVTVTTLVDSTAVPSNINAVPLKNQVTVTWDAVDGATGYEVEADGIRINTNTNTSYIQKNLQPGTDHTYRVRSKKGTMISDWSAMTIATTLTDAFGTPANIVTDVQDTSVSLTWDAVTSATGYDVEIDGTVIDVNNDTAFTHNSLQPNSTHTYRVRAKSATETSPWSDALTFTTYILPTPQNIVTMATGSTITVTWDPTANADAYDVEIDGATIPDITNTTYTIEGLTPGTQHTVRLRSKSIDGTSNWSITQNIATESNTTNIPEVSGVSRKTSITILWEAMSGVTAYDLEIDGILIENITNTSYNLTNLTAGSSHIVKARVKNGEWSNPITLLTLREKPAAPTSVVCSANRTSILLTWDKVTGAESYEVEADGVVIDAGAGSSYLHSGLTPDTEHKYRVRAKNKDGYSEWSSIVTQKTLNAVQTFNLECVAGEELNLTLSAKGIQELSAYTFTIKYNIEDFDVVDLCGMTARIDTITGDITGTDVKITQYEPGTIVFTKKGTAENWEQMSGIVNSIIFKAKKSGTLSITYTIN